MPQNRTKNYGDLAFDDALQRSSLDCTYVGPNYAVSVLIRERLRVLRERIETFELTA